METSAFEPVGVRLVNSQHNRPSPSVFPPKQMPYQRPLGVLYNNHHNKSTCNSVLALCQALL